MQYSFILLSGIDYNIETFTWNRRQYGILDSQGFLQVVVFVMKNYKLNISFTKYIFYNYFLSRIIDDCREQSQTENTKTLIVSK